MSSRVVLLSESPPKLYFIKHQRNMYQMAWARVAFQGGILESLSLEHRRRWGHLGLWIWLAEKIQAGM